MGKNMMAFEYEHDIVIIDMGLQFPTEDMLGVDYVLPDATYLIERKHLIRGVFLTHGHLDHVGYLPRLVKEGFHGQIWCTAPTCEIAKVILEDSAKIQEEAAEHANRFRYSKL